MTFRFLPAARTAARSPDAVELLLASRRYRAGAGGHAHGLRAGLATAKGGRWRRFPYFIPSR